MKHRRAIYLGFLAALVVAAIASIALRRGEPLHHGRTMSEWIKEATEGPEDQRQQAVEALLNMKPDVFPRLIRMLRANDSALKRAIVHLASRQSVVRVHLHTADEQHDQALLAFDALGASARPALPALEELLNDPPTAHLAQRALGAIGSDAVPVFARALTNGPAAVRPVAALGLGRRKADATTAVPLLVRCLDKTNHFRLRAIAVTSLGRLASEPAVAVPALIETLSDDDTHVRRASATALGDFGTNAAIAVQPLGQALNDPDPWVVRGAAQALAAITNSMAPSTLSR